MEVMLNQFIGYNLKAADGYLGKVCDFYFDDRSWKVQFLVVDTAGSLQEEILISPLALLQPDVATKTFPVKITLRQLKSSPKMDINQQLSGAQLSESCEHFEKPGSQYKRYRECLEPVHARLYSSISLPMSAIVNGDETQDDERNRNFRRTQVIAGSVIQSFDTVLGKIFDYIIEDTNWEIRYVVIKIEKSLSNKHILMDSRHLNNVHWSAGAIELNL